MSEYSIYKLKDNVFLIRWHAVSANAATGTAWAKDIQSLLDAAEAPVVLVSDLRQGYLTDVHGLRRAGQLASHRYWGGSIALGAEKSTRFYVELFDRLNAKGTGDMLVTSPQQVIEALERLKPGLSEGVDWEQELPPL